jgi:hypothetical protein
MTLPADLGDVAVGSPHAASHNAERAAINAIKAAVAAGGTGGGSGIVVIATQADLPVGTPAGTPVMITGAL